MALNVGKLYIEITADTLGAERSLSSLEKGFNRLGQIVTAGAIVKGLASIGKAVISVGSSFEAGMSEVEAISGAAGKELEALTEKAKEMGATTKFSATESAEALKYMAMAGWDSQQMLDGLPTVMNLAAASGENLGAVSDIVTDALTAFGMKANESARFADVLAAASSNSNTNVGMMGETFKYVAPLAGAMGFSIEDTALAIGLMANSGIKASQAGTALRGLLTRLIKPTKQSQAAMDDLGISVTNADGSIKPFGEIIGDLRERFGELSKVQKGQYAAMLAGQAGMSGFLGIVNATETDVNKLTSAISNSTGEAERMAKTMNDNLTGDVTILKSALEGLGIQIYESFQTPLRDSAQYATKAVDDIASAFNRPDIKSSLNSIGQAIGNVMDSMVEIVEKGAPIVVKTLGAIAENADLLTATVAGLGAAFVALKIGTVVQGIVATFQTASLQIALFTAANGTAAVSQGVLAGSFKITELAVLAFSGKVKASTIAQGAFNVVANANPLGLVAATIGIAVGAYVLLSKTVMKASEETVAFHDSMTETINANMDLIRSLEDSENAYKDNIGQINMEIGATALLADKVFALAEQENKSASEKKALATMVDSLNKSMPELNVHYDEYSDTLSHTSEQIKGMLENKRQLLEAQAQEERSLELAKEQISIQEQLVAASDQLTAARQRMGELSEEYQKFNSFKDLLGAVKEETLSLGTAKVQLQDEIFKTSNEIAALAAEEARLKQELEDTKESLGESIARTTELSSANQAAGESAAEFGDASSEAYLEAMSAYDRFISSLDKDSLEDFLKDQEEAAKSWSDNVLNLFEKVSVESEVSLKEIAEKLRHNAAAAREWSDNLELVAKSGLDEGLVNHLREGREATAGELKLIADALKDNNGEITGELKELNNAWQDGMSAVSETVDTETKVIVDAAMGALDVSEIEAHGEKWGGALSGGINYGLESSFGMPIKTTESLAQKIIKAGESTLEINSPSKAFMRMGDFVTTGLSKGIESGRSNAVNAIVGVATSLLNKAKQALGIHSPSKLFKEIGLDIDKGWAGGIEGGGSLVQEAVFKVSRKGIEGVEDWLKKKKEKTEINAAEEVRIWASVAQKYQEGTQQRAQTDERLFEATQTWLKERKELISISAEEEIQLWFGISQQYQENTKQRVQADAEMLSSIQNYVKDAGLSANEEVRIWQEATRLYKEGTTARAEADQHYYEAKKRLEEQILELEQKYYDAVEARSKEIVDSFGGLFSGIIKEEGHEIGKLDLFNGLQNQMTSLQNWLDSVTALTSRGLDEGFVAEVRKLGPSAQDELHVLNSMTNEELTNYVDLWKEKQELARKQAEQELKGMKEDTEKQITAMMDGVDEIFIEKVEDSKKNGANLIKALADGIKSESNTVYSVIEKIANQAMDKMKKIWDIHSPSRKFRFFGEMAGEGLALGIQTTYKDVEKAMSKIPALESLPVGIDMQKAGINAINGTYNLMEYEQAFTSGRKNERISKQPKQTEAPNIHVIINLDNAMFADQSMVDRLSQQVSERIATEYRRKNAYRA